MSMGFSTWLPFRSTAWALSWWGVGKHKHVDCEVQGDEMSTRSEALLQVQALLKKEHFFTSKMPKYVGC